MTPSPGEATSSAPQAARGSATVSIRNLRILVIKAPSWVYGRRVRSSGCALGSGRALGVVFDAKMTVRRISTSQIGHAFATIGRRHSTEIRSEEHTSELQSLMRISYAVFCLKHKTLN